jgi:hypothetical protein
MFTEAAFNSAAAELARLNGISEDLAGELLARIGDTPELADNGQVIVRDEAGQEIARVRWPL